MSYATGGPFKCSFCPPQPHHDTKDWQLEGSRFKEISLGADNGCFWCTIFRQGIQEFSPLSDPESNAVFQWSGMLLEAYYAETKLNLELEFFCDKNDLDIVEGLEKALPVPTSTGSTESYSWASKQFKICVNSHNPCRIIDTSFQPSRLLDVEGHGCESRVRLVSSREERLPHGTEYACLSHCWGSSNVKCITTQDTLEQNKQGIPWDLMPRTFQEAIKFICKIGIRYLWIDSLCIIQDDQDDWRKEAATMCEIYSNSTLTLAASASADSNQGLFREMNPRHEARELLMTLPGRNSIRILTRVPLPHFPRVRTKSQDEEDAPLLRRGWAFQERLLSPRVLHFAANELVWECMEGIDCQCRPRTFSTGIKSSLSSILRGGPGSSDNQPKLAAMEWLDIVKHYGKLSLTFREDKLAAISGAAKRTRQFDMGDEYVAGFWKEDLPHGLAWNCDETAPNARPTTWTAPTWSWACLDSSVNFIHLGRPPDRIYATVNQTECFAAGPDPTGQIVYGQIVISGPAADVELKYNESAMRDSPTARCQYMYTIFFGSEPVGTLWPDYAFGAEGKGHLASGSALVCLLVYEYNRGNATTRCCLVLTKTGREPDAYERVGCLMLFKEENYSLFCERSSERIYTII